MARGRSLIGKLRQLNATSSTVSPASTRGDAEGREFDQEKRLKEDTGRYFAILDTAVDAIIVANRFGRVQTFNHAAEQIFGYSAAEVSAKTSTSSCPNPTRPKHDGYIAAYRETGERKIIGIGREVVGRRKDGSTVPLEVSIAEWRDVDGRQCFTGIMRDVTLRKQQARDLQNASEAAATGAHRGRERQPRQDRISRRHEPRNPHAADQHQRLRRSPDADRQPDPPAAPLRRTGEDGQRRAADHRQ